ncbi:hypothetical protein COU74_03880 [Candidatus Peregrinibacteria bacterium CG10_big_fil_rev_8_21_14_0_10_36_19]|nr:MAG: hypothetical protein COU74_03880 [Candidatus Peregrinibacteria bacterium CG10_big_fil_rev_8_21_14_0_10_36_19]
MLKKATVTDHKYLTDDVVELTFKVEGNFNYAAGQFTTIRIQDNNPTPCFRAYSISSAPSSLPGHFQTCLKVVEGGRGSNWLASLNVGDEINFLGPSGKFLFTTPKEKTAVFVATGTGITPFLSMINEELNKGSTQKLHLLLGLRHIKNVFYTEELEKLSTEHENFSYNITLSRPENESWQGKTGRVTEHLDNLNPETTEIYICGLKEMIDAVIEKLKNLGFKEENIHFEKYD